MKRGLRKLLLTAHVTFSVGWLGAVAAYLAPAIVGLTSDQPEVVRSCYVAMGLMGWFVIVPLALGALATGLVQSLATEWGLFRHYWIATKLVLAVIGVAILVAHMQQNFGGVPAMGMETLLTAPTAHVKMHLFVHAIGGLVILLAATTLSIFKPWGKTPWGRRKAA
jgi:hypothetical protein